MPEAVDGPDDGSLSGLDEFTRRLGEDDARVLVDLLKLAVAGRAGSRATPAITKVLTGKCCLVHLSHIPLVSMVICMFF